jgi:hypothetical protein
MTPVGLLATSSRLLVASVWLLAPSIPSLVMLDWLLLALARSPLASGRLPLASARSRVMWLLVLAVRPLFTPGRSPVLPTRSVFAPTGWGWVVRLPGFSEVLSLRDRVGPWLCGGGRRRRGTWLTFLWFGALLRLLGLDRWGLGRSPPPALSISPTTSALSTAWRGVLFLLTR